MAAKRKVTQDDLRKLMADLKSDPGKTSSGNKKSKLSSKELALIEDQKRQKSIRDQEKIRLKQEKMARIVPNQGLQPKKSILKTTSVSNYNPHLQNHQFSNWAAPGESSSTQKPSHSKKTENEDSPATSNGNDVTTATTDESAPDKDGGTIPEGFFDDPKLDAKARNVQYVDHNEEEWEKFQKEIGDEVATAQEILVEDRNEATADRQLEDIDEQIEAWKRVAQLEEKKEAIVKTRGVTEKVTEEESDSGSDVELDDLTDWRKKS